MAEIPKSVVVGSNNTPSKGYDYIVTALTANRRAKRKGRNPSTNFFPPLTSSGSVDISYCTDFGSAGNACVHISPY